MEVDDVWKKLTSRIGGCAAAGLRHSRAPGASGGERAAVQTLRDVWRRLVGANASWSAGASVALPRFG